MEAIADQMLATDNNFPEVSIIMPCLDEADTLAACIGKARRALNEQKISGEIIVADNGSTDGSPAIATKLGAPLINARRCTAWNQLGSHVIFNTSPLNY